MIALGDTFPRPNAADVTSERLDGEVIAVHLGTGRYYSMSGPAADVWWLMDQSVPADAWLGILEGAYPGSVDPAGVADFVAACRSASLVAEGPMPASTVAPMLPSDHTRAPWTSPVLEEFDDLQDLILVDPVHDTSALGWPHVADSDG